MNRDSIRTPAAVVLLLLLVSARGVLHAQDPATVGSSWAVFEEILRARESADPVRARVLAERGIVDHGSSVAIAQLYGELVLTRSGPAGFASTIDSLARAGHTESNLAVFRAIEHRAWQRSDLADSAYASLGHGGSLDVVDGLMLTLQQIRASLRTGGIFGPSQIDSMIAWARAQIPVLAGADSAREHFELAFEMADAATLLHRGQTQSGLESMEAARTRAQRSGHPTLEMGASISLGVALNFSPDHSRRIATWTRALDLAEQLGETRMAAVARNYRGTAFGQGGRIEEALADWSKAAETFVRLGDVVGHAWNRLSYGWYVWLKGDIDPAEGALRSALQSFVELDQPFGRGMALNNLGVVYYSTNRVQEAIDAYEQALELAIGAGNLRLQSDLYNNIANLRRTEGDWDETLRLYGLSLDLARQLSDVSRMISRLGNLGLVSMDLGHLEQARLFYEEAMALGREQGVQEGFSAMNYASGLVTLGRYDEAEPLLERANEIARRASNEFLRAGAQLNLGRLFAARGSYELALSALDSADAVYRRRGIHHRRLPGLIIQSRCLRELGRYERALELAQEFEDLARERANTYDRSIAENMRAIPLAALGRGKEAQTACRQAIEFYLRSRDEAGSSRVSRSEVASSIFSLAGYSAFTSLVEVFDLAKQRPSSEATLEAFDVLQKLKAVSLLERLQSASTRVRPQVSAEVLGEERESRLRVARLMSALESAPSESLRIELAQAEAMYHRAQARVLEEDERYRRASVRSVVTANDVQPMLEPGTLVLDYFVHDRSPIVLFAMDSESTAVHVLEQSSEIRTQLDLFLRLIQERPSHPNDVLASRSIAEDLFERLLGPERERIARSQRLVVAPDGFLHHVPFAALATDSTYLIEQVAVTTVPSLSVWLDLRNRRSSAEGIATNDVAIWIESGDEDDASEARLRVPAGQVALPYGRVEASKLASTFARTRTFVPGDTETGAQALASAGILGSSRVMHFIAHGVFDERRPWMSGLQLNSNAEDEQRKRLDATDVYYLDFTCDLVTLASCETARGSGLSGQGLPSFAQALFGSGATSVLATLWRIDDASTPDFMVRFYRELATGRSKSESLAWAQRSFIGDPRFHHPFFWGSFVLLGDGASHVPLELQSETNRGLLYLALAATALILALLLRRRSRG